MNDEICRLTVLANQLGYLPQGQKTFVVESSHYALQPHFWLCNVNHFGENYRVFEGDLCLVDGDFGSYWVGDFSPFQTPGTYVIMVLLEGVSAPGLSYHSHPFQIASEVYSPLVEHGLECFATQRCGPSTTGYHAPCHLDDGVRTDNGVFLDVVGGWHDANDLLKWSGATLSGMVGLLGIASKTREPQKLARLYEELRWGNLYFLKLQDPQGYFYSHGIGGDPPEQGNHFTDNLRNTPDDRKIVTKPGQPYLQHLFIRTQSDLARLFHHWDAPYALNCLDAALRCFRWVNEQPKSTYFDYGTGAEAGWTLYQATQDPQYLDYAAHMAAGFSGLQQIASANEELSGFFYQDEQHLSGASHVSIETLALVGFCRFIEEAHQSGQMDVSPWKETVRRYCDDFLLPLAARNAYGIPPFQVKLEEKLLPGSRTFKECSYRYFMSHLNGNWWVGSNAHLAGSGLALMAAARIFSEERYQAAAQRLLDWILGVNPFNVSLVNGIGHANPPEYIYTGFQPRTPKITGAVICGICGDEEDRPDLQSGCYHSAEIWTPMTIQTMWLGWELSCYYRSTKEKKASPVVKSM